MVCVLNDNTICAVSDSTSCVVNENTICVLNDNTICVLNDSMICVLIAGAGIIGPGLTSVNLLASSLLMGGPSLESHFSNLRSLSEDRSVHNTDGSPGSSQRNSIDSNNSDLGVQATQAQQHAAMVNAAFTVGAFGPHQNAFASSPGARRPG